MAAFQMTADPPGRGRVSLSTRLRCTRRGMNRRFFLGGLRPPKPSHRVATGVPLLPPLGGGAGLPPPSGGRAGEGGRHLRCNGLPLKQGDGETGFPHPLTRWESLEGLRPHAGVWGTQVPYAPARARALPSSKNMGEPGSPIPPARRRVWEGDALTQGDGEPGFPHAPPRRGMGKPGFPIPPFALGGAPPGGMDG